MESFGARFPRVFSDSGFKGWFVSTLLLGNGCPNNFRFVLANTHSAAWLGSLINGPLSDRVGRKISINLAVIVFVIGSAIQCAAVNIPMLFVGRAIAGLAIGMLTMVVPLYISEVSITAISLL